MASRVPDGTDAPARSGARSASAASGRGAAATGSAWEALATATSPVSFRKPRRSIIPPGGPATALRERQRLAGPIERIDTLPAIFYHTETDRPTVRRGRRRFG